MTEPGGGAVHITLSRKTSARHGLIAHRRVLSADELTTHHGVPTTTVARTLLDLAATEGLPALERALREATFRGLTDPLGLPALLARYPGGRGTAVAARALERGVYALRTRSELEAGFLDYLVERRLPLPETNALVEAGEGRFEVDCLWRESRLVVELDGASHLEPERVRADRRRDGLLQAHGLAVHRIGSDRLAEDGDGVERQLAAALRL